MAKKNLIEEALIEARELERASIENAKDIVLESFTPNFVSFFSDVLNEADHPEPDGDEDEYGNEPEDHDEDEEEMNEGNEHDVGKEPDSGRQGTDAAVDDEEESLPQDQKDEPMKEGKYDDVKGDATPEKGQAGLPAGDKPKVKKVGDSGWEDEGTAGYAADDPEKNKDDVQGGSPKPKKVGKGGWEKEHEGGTKYSDTSNADPEKNADQLPGGTPSAKKDVYEAEDKEDDSEDKKELDVPEELFDDGEEDGAEGKDKDDDVDISIDVDDEDDDEKDSMDEGADVDIEIEDEDEDEEDEEIDEGLYIRQEGRFKKITPAEYLQTRIDTLEEERDRLVATVETLQGQLQETHLFNAKLAHMNKLTMSGAFTNSEKERIAERLDECDTVDEVKALYKTIVSEVQDVNPLDSFANLIKETRMGRSTKTKNIYESADVARMKKLVDYEFE